MRNNKDLFKFKPSVKLLKLMMDHVENSDSLYYVIVILNEYGVPMVYLEPSSEPYYGYCRVFINKNDAEEYMEAILLLKKYQPNRVKKYVLSIRELFLLCKNTHKAVKKKKLENNKCDNIKYSINYIENGIFYDLGVIWDSLPH